MIPGRIQGATTILGAPHGWDEARDGPCDGLAVRQEVVRGLPMQTSAWLPNPDEIARIAAGAPVVLTIIAGGHPPVSLDVGQPPEEETPP